MNHLIGERIFYTSSDVLKTFNDHPMLYQLKKFKLNLMDTSM